METRALMAGCCVFFIKNTVCVVLPLVAKALITVLLKWEEVKWKRSRNPQDRQETAVGEVGGGVKGQEAPQTLTE